MPLIITLLWNLNEKDENRFNPVLDYFKKIILK